MMLRRYVAVLGTVEASLYLRPVGDGRCTMPSILWDPQGQIDGLPVKQSLMEALEEAVSRFFPGCPTATKCAEVMHTNCWGQVEEIIDVFLVDGYYHNLSEIRQVGLGADLCPVTRNVVDAITMTYDFAGFRIPLPDPQHLFRLSSREGEAEYRNNGILDLPKPFKTTQIAA